MIDNGRVGENQMCPPQLLAFDLNTDRLVERTKIPLNVATNSKKRKGSLVTPIVETEGPWCKRTHVSGIIFIGGKKIFFGFLTKVAFFS